MNENWATKPLEWLGPVSIQYGHVVIVDWEHSLELSNSNS